MKTKSIKRFKIDLSRSFNSFKVPKDSQILSFENDRGKAIVSVLVDNNNTENEVKYFISIEPNLNYLKHELKDNEYIGMARFEQKKELQIHLFEIKNPVTIEFITGRKVK